MLEKYVESFEEHFDCNNDENSQWKMAITNVI